MDTQIEEEWRPAVGFEGLYSVSSTGKVRSEPRVVVEKTGVAKLLSGRELKQQPNRGGYLCLAFCVNGKRIPLRVHGIVASAFLGTRPGYRHEVAHNDGNRANNRADNLRWDTRAGNFADKVPHGTHNRGDRHPNCKIASGMSAAQFSSIHGISPDHARRVLSNNKRRSA